MGMRKLPGGRTLAISNTPAPTTNGNKPIADAIRVVVTYLGSSGVSSGGLSSVMRVICAHCVVLARRFMFASAYGGGRSSSVASLVHLPFCMREGSGEGFADRTQRALRAPPLAPPAGGRGTSTRQGSFGLVNQLGNDIDHRPFYMHHADRLPGHH